MIACFFSDVSYFGQKCKFLDSFLDDLTHIHLFKSISSEYFYPNLKSQISNLLYLNLSRYLYLDIKCDVLQTDLT